MFIVLGSTNYNVGKFIANAFSSCCEREENEQAKRERQRERQREKEKREAEEERAEFEYRLKHPKCTHMFLHFDMDREIAVDSNWKFKNRK